MKRYTQPQAGTSDKQAKRDLENNNIPVAYKAGSYLESLQYLYKGEIKSEWQ